MKSAVALLIQPGNGCCKWNPANVASDLLPDNTDNMKHSSTGAHQRFFNNFLLFFHGAYIW